MTVAPCLAPRGLPFPGIAPPRRAPGRADALTEAAALALAALFVLLLLVGAPPYGGSAADAADPAARASGNALNQAAQLALVALAAPVIAARRDLAWAVVAGWPGLWIALGLCLASVTWSDFPEITLRRAVAVSLSAVIALAVAVGPRDPRRLHAALLAGLGIVAALDVGALALAPGIAIEESGARGLHSSKNMAGLAMAVVVVGAATWILGARRLAEAVPGAVVLAVAAAFLVATASKTSIGLTLLVVGAGVPFILVWRADAGAGAAMALAAVAAAAAAVVAIAVLDWSRADVLTAVFGDPTFTNRTPIWDFALDEIARRPLLGFGYGAFWDVGPAHDPVLRAPLSNWLSQVEVGVINQAHNGYIDLALQIGAPGAALVTWVVLRGAASAAALLRAPLGPGAAGLAAFAFLILATFVPHNMMEASLLSRPIPAGAFVVLALLLTARLRADAARRGGAPR